MSKKTLWIINQYSSTPEFGYGGRSYYLGKELVKLGYTVYIFASNNHHLLKRKPNFHGDYYEQNVEGLNFVWFNMPKYKDARSKKRVYLWVKFAYKISKLNKYKFQKPDIILQTSPSPIPFLGAYSLSKKLNSKLIFEVRDIWPLTLIEIGGISKNHPFIKLLQWVEDFAYKKSDLVFSNLKFSWKHMVSRGMDKSKFRWIPNGFDKEEFDNPEPLDSNFLNNIPKNKFIVGYAGTIGISNNVESIVEVADMLKNIEDIHFLVVGSGPSKINIEEDARKRKLENITFLDPVEKSKVPSLYKTFDVCFLCMSDVQLNKFGTSLQKYFEYLASGKPMLYAVNSPEFDYVEKYAAGYEVPSVNNLDISNAIFKLYNLPDKDIKQMGINARKLAENEFEYSMLAKKMDQYLKDL
ncbi:glycosyltransferase family 4 protein [Taylorella asinigenitalis]|uniref:glycosyltransferase family 4 protein n=1 Tax=Taylorella asinigenitalis TaxID=84590 RepID=UPI00048B61A5|nr:glycosyltransferase family 4 protein [Taylorella asinigenitalis]